MFFIKLNSILTIYNKNNKKHDELVGPLDYESINIVTKFPSEMYAGWTETKTVMERVSNT